MNRYIIIVAAGKGTRMGSELPKQFIALDGLPIVMHTIGHMHDCAPDASIVLVLAKENVPLWHELVQRNGFNIPVQIAHGGSTRFESVKNGIDCIPTNEEALVAIHDGVRPFVAKEVVENCFTEAEKHGAVIPVIPPVESVRLLKDETSTIFDRNKCRLVQTPQTFKLSVLNKAYAQAYDESFTDDASVVEKTGHEITLVAGNRENIKITTPFDLAIAKAMKQDGGVQ